jgi:hypothetical protein
MPKLLKGEEKPKSQKQPESLKGWTQISEFLGEPVSVVKRWAAEGMPLHREGRFVSTSSDALNAWLGHESGKPVHVATENTDLTAELKRGLSFVRREKPQRPKRKTSASSGKIKRKRGRRKERREGSETTDSGGGRRTARHGGVFAQSRKFDIVGNFKSNIRHEGRRSIPVDDARITSKNRPRP